MGRMGRPHSGSALATCEVVFHSRENLALAIAKALTPPTREAYSLPAGGCTGTVILLDLPAGREDANATIASKVLSSRSSVAARGGQSPYDPSRSFQS